MKTKILLILLLCSACAYSQVYNVPLNGTANAKSKIDSTINKAKIYLAGGTGRSAVVNFAAGTYHIYHPGTPGITIQNIGKNLTLRGAGKSATTLVFHNYNQIGMHVRGVDSLTIENMHFTRSEIYTTQGKVKELINSTQFKFKIYPGFPDMYTYFLNGAGNERTLFKYKGNAINPVADSESSYKIKIDTIIPDAVDTLLFTVVTDNNISHLNIGDKLAMKSKVGAFTLNVRDVENFILQDAKFTNGAGVPINIKGANEHVKVLRVSIDRSDTIQGIRPYFSTPGGGIQIESNTIGPIVKDCKITATADDAIAVFATSASSLNKDILIKGNIITGNQARGINITGSKGGLCDSNIVTNSNIQIKTNESGIRTQNFKVTRNRLINTYRDGAIFSTVELFGADTTKWVNNINITGNIVENLPRNTAFCNLKNINVVKIQDNIIQSFSSDTLLESIPALIYFPSSQTNLSWISGTNNCYNGTSAIPLKYPSGVNVTVSECGGLLTNISSVRKTDLKLSNDILVYPNPSSNEINIKKELSGVFDYSLFDLLGNVLIKGKLEIENKKLNIEHLTPGIYFLLIENKSISKSFKIVKE